jgi:thioredoxin 1
MKTAGKIIIVVILIAAIAVVSTIRQKGHSGGNIDALKPEQLLGNGLPVLIDLGAGTCIPCKMMTPVLEELTKEMKGKLLVKFIDVSVYPELTKAYGINLIPTQIFYDASGKELFRHEGFYSKEDILAKWEELGVELAKAE